MKCSTRSVFRPHSVALTVSLIAFVMAPLALVELAYSPTIIGTVLKGHPVVLLDFVSIALQCLPWIFMVGVGCLLFAVATAILKILGKRIRISAWIPPVLAFPLAAVGFSAKGWIGTIFSILAAAGFTLYWLVFWQADAILHLRKRIWFASVCTWCLILMVLACLVLVPQYLHASRVADAFMKTATDGPWTRSTAVFVMENDFDSTVLFYGPRWVFRYRNEQTGEKSRRIYVRVPEYEAYHYTIVLDPVPAFGVLP